MDIKRTPKRIRVQKRAMRVCTVLLVAAPILGFVIRQWKDANTLAAHPPPGSFVNIDGRKLHCRTSGHGEFTFVLEAGMGGYSQTWGTFEKSLAEVGRVFVYDRAGLGWSEEGPQPRTARQITSELHRALEQAKIPGPFVLVGHSFGGLTQTLYALRYPENVAGLLLIDPSTKNQGKKLPAPPALSRLMPQISRLAPIGLPQLLMGFSDPIANRTSHVCTTGAEMRAFMNGAEEWGDLPLDLGHTPIYVLTAGVVYSVPGKSEAESKAVWDTWKSLHDELTAASSSEIRKHEIVGGASHFIHRSHPEAIISAAREMIGRIRAATSALSTHQANR
jgi:pimeloyl-ACP methyl ester carboxylesterase